MKGFWIVLIAAALAFGLAGTLFADDFAPPAWRGHPLTVAAEWEFVSPILTDLPPDSLIWVGDGIHPYNNGCATEIAAEEVGHEPAGPFGFIAQKAYFSSCRRLRDKATVSIARS